MPQCDYCGDEVDYPFTCNYCEQPHCSDHRLPEAYECVGLYDRTARHFESDAPNTASVSDERRGGSAASDDDDGWEPKGWPDDSADHPSPSESVGTVGSTPDSHG